MSITEPLDIVEDEPSQRDDHQDNKWNGNKQNWCAVDIASMTWLCRTNNDVHQYTCSVVYQWSNVLAILLVHKDWHQVIHYIHTTVTTTLQTRQSQTADFVPGLQLLGLVCTWRQCKTARIHRKFMTTCCSYSFNKHRDKFRVNVQLARQNLKYTFQFWYPYTLSMFILVGTGKTLRMLSLSLSFANSNQNTQNKV